jgi:hypothetical protein
MDNTLHGTPPTGASVTSGAVSAAGAITAGGITLNTVAIPAIAGGADAPTQVDQLVAAINSMQNVTGILAVRVTTTTFKLQSTAPLVVAALGGGATLANSGLTAGTTAATPPLLGTRKQFGTNANGSDEDVIAYGNQWMTLRAAGHMGLVQKVNGVYVENQPAQASTRVNS